MTRVLIQAGHSAAFQPFQSGGGGAPGEAAWVTDLANRLADRLEAHADVTLVGCWNLDNSNAPAVVTGRDYDLFLALHYDADVYAVHTGCFAGRAAGDPLGAESDRFIELWAPRYTAATGIPLHPERLNPNVTDYYAFRATTAKTPGVLIEHGVGPEANLDTAADADAAAVLAFLQAPVVPIVDVHSGGDATTTDARGLLDLLAQRQITTPQQLRDLYAWTDEIYKERTDLEAEVAALRQQQSGAQATGVTVALAATVTYADGRAVPVPVTLKQETP